MNSFPQRRWTVFVLLTLTLIWFSGYAQREVQTFRGKALSDFYDFSVYYTAGLVARSETDRRLYSTQQITDPNDPAKTVTLNPQFQSPDPNSTYGSLAAAAETKSDGQYLYPSFFSVAFIPITYVPFETAKPLWHFLIFALAVGAVILTVRLFYEDRLTVAAISLIIVAAVEFTLPMQDLFYGCNVSSLILFLLAAGIYLQKKHPVFGALFFALAVFIKLTPIVIVPLLLVRRQWKWLAAFGCWSVLLLAISIWQTGWQNQVEFFTSVMPAMSSGVPHLDNRSLSTAVYVLYSGEFLSYDAVRAGAYAFPAFAPILFFKLLTLISYGGLLFYFWKLRKDDSQIVTEIFVLILWSIIFSPVSLRYNYLIALAPVIFAWLHPSSHNASPLMLSVLAIGTLMIFSIIHSYALMLTQAFPAQFVLFMMMPVGVILCAAYLLLQLKKVAKTPIE